MVERLGGDVLALALCAGAAQVDRGRQPCEVGIRPELAPLALVVADGQGRVCNEVIGRAQDWFTVIPMKGGVPTEIKADEYRVSLTPAGVRELTQRGHDV